MTVRPVPARRSLAGALAILVALAGCSTAGGSGGDDRLVVVTTTTVFADLVAQVGGDRVAATSLVPRGGEVHTFDPTPSDMRRIVAADLVVMNGLGLDEWLAALVADAGTDAPVVELAEDLDGVEYLAPAHAEGESGHEGEGHEGEEANPHLWLDVGITRRYVERIADALAAADPEGAGAYRDGAAGYDARLAALDAEVRAAVGALPADRRRVVSFHEAFPYFARAYGIEIVDTIVDAPGQEPSAGEVAALVQAIRGSGVSAILAEAQFSDDLARTIAGETGVAVISDLYTDSLGDPPADTYEGLIRHDAARIVESLGS